MPRVSGRVRELLKVNQSKGVTESEPHDCEERQRKQHGGI